MHSGPAEAFSEAELEVELAPPDSFDGESAARAELAPPRTSAMTTTEWDRTRFIVLPPALRRDRLAVETKLVTPVLAVERPDDVLFIGFDDIGLRLLGCHEALFELLVEHVALGSGHIHEDLGAVAEILFQVFEIALVPSASEVAGVADGKLAGVMNRIFHEIRHFRPLEAAGRPLEASVFLIEQSHVLQVAKELSVRERRLDDGGHLRVETRFVVANVSQELVELLFLIRSLPELVQNLSELFVDRLVLRLELRNDRQRVVVLTVREVDDGLEDVRLGVKRVREIGRLNGVDVA